MTKKTTILSFILILVGLIAFIMDHPFQHRFEPENIKPFYPNLDTQSITVIEINYFTQGTRLEKKDHTWFVQGRKNPPLPDWGEQVEADESKVMDLLSAVKELEISDPVTSDPQKQSAFQLIPNSLSVTLWDNTGEKKVRFYIGKQGPDIFSTFIRDENSNDIYLVDIALQGMLNIPWEEWKKEKRNE